MVKEVISKKYELNKADGGKILKGAGIACGSALLVYVAQILPQINFGVYAPMVMAVAGIGINVGAKWLKDNK